ncbi:MAG: hypothetical protein ABIB11_05300, partial [Candidatus Omnitrophota bacterium]
TPVAEPKEEKKEAAPAKPEPKEEKKEEPVPVQETVQPQAAVQSADGSEKKRKKIKNMSLKEIEVKIKHVKESMGNLQSRYARELCKQRDLLSGE